MIKVHDVYQKLNGNEKVDELTKNLCREFLFRHPLTWIKRHPEYAAIDEDSYKLCKEFLFQQPLTWINEHPEYVATDEDGYNYVYILHVNGKFLIKEGNHFDATFSSDLKLSHENFLDAIESANEILYNVGFFVRPYDLG